MGHGAVPGGGASLTPRATKANEGSASDRLHVRSIASLLAPLFVALLSVVVLPLFVVRPELAWPVRETGILASILVGVSTFRTSQTRAPFSPLGLFFIYTVLTLTVSAMAAAAGQFDPTFLSSTFITPDVLKVQALFIVGLFLGSWFQSGRTETKIANEPSDASYRLPSLRQGGIIILGLCALYRLYFLGTHGLGSWNQARGSDFNLAPRTEVIVSLGPLLALCMLFLADHARRRFLIGALPIIMFALWAAASLLIGSRDEVLGPALLLLWMYHYRVRRINGAALSLIVITGFILLAFVGIWRAGATGSSQLSFLRPVATSTNTLSKLMAAVPGTSPFLRGETYRAAIDSGVVFGSVHTDPASQSAALRFPSTVGFTARSGLGFSPVSEAFWNFGYAGSLLAPFVFGLILVWSHRRARAWPRSPLALLYPIFLARLPIGLRSDFLQQYKGILLVMGLLTLVWALNRRREGVSMRSSRRSRHDGRPDVRSASGVRAGRESGAPFLARGHAQERHPGHRLGSKVLAERSAPARR